MRRSSGIRDGSPPSRLTNARASMSDHPSRRKSLAMQERALNRIPGGYHLLSKRPARFAPGQWPGYYDRAEGVQIWDLDGNRYIDMSIGGIGANVLGYADPDVNAAVCSAIAKGSS